MDRNLALIDRLERLHPAVVADCLDRLGARSQCRRTATTGTEANWRQSTRCSQAT
jgi:hypothetical protein